MRKKDVDTPRTDHQARNKAGADAPLHPQPSLFEEPPVDAAEATDESPERLVVRDVESLKPPPALERHDLLLPLDRLLALEKSDDPMIEILPLITQDDVIIDGSEFWQIAKRQGRAKLLCRVCQASEEEALLLFLRYQRRPVWLNGFSRVLLVLDLESWLCKRALANQIAGGEGKALAKLAEAEKVNCREALSKLSGECEGNVDKVRKILKDSIPQLIAAARSGEISIHGAWKLSKLARSGQQAALASRRSKKRSQTTLRGLVKRAESSDVKTCLRELLPILARIKAIPQLRLVWDKIADLLDAIDRGSSDSQGAPNEQQA